VLVTGARGQLARAIAGLQAQAPELEFVFAARPELDLAEGGSASAIIAQVSPDAVVNAAAYTAVDRAEAEPELAFAVNASGAGELAEAAARSNVPMMHISTDYVFDGEASEPYFEDAAANPLNVYGASKLAGERAVAAANPRHMIVRTSWVHSATGSNFVKTMLRLASERDEVRVVGDQIGCPTSADSLATALLQILKRWSAGDQAGQGGTYHVAGSSRCSWAEFASEIFRLSGAAGGPTAAVVPISTDEYPTPARRPHFTVLDCGKFDSEFGMRLPDWRTALAPIVAQLLEAG
jgi:dTDP-4-dehydrorhamnose reductase